MADSRGENLAAGAHRWARLALGLMVVGPSTLLVYAWVEVLHHPGMTLVDGYWIGRLPWTALGILVTLSGAVLGAAAGAVAIVIEGGWWRRLLIVPAYAASAAWWLTALGVLPYPRFHGPDPVTFAYDLPVAATLLMLMPAALLAILCLTPRLQGPPRTRLRRVPPRDTWSDPAHSPDDNPI